MMKKLVIARVSRFSPLFFFFTWVNKTYIHLKLCNKSKLSGVDLNKCFVVKLNLKLRVQKKTFSFLLSAPIPHNNYQPADWPLKKILKHYVKLKLQVQHWTYYFCKFSSLSSLGFSFFVNADLSSAAWNKHFTSTSLNTLWNANCCCS